MDNYLYIPDYLFRKSKTFRRKHELSLNHSLLLYIGQINRGQIRVYLTTHRLEKIIQLIEKIQLNESTLQIPNSLSIETTLKR